jgi:hypothetical protein
LVDKCINRKEVNKIKTMGLQCDQCFECIYQNLCDNSPDNMSEDKQCDVFISLSDGGSNDVFVGGDIFEVSYMELYMMHIIQ